MNKDQLKSLVKSVIREMATPTQQPDLKAQTFQALDKLAKDLAQQKAGTPEHAKMSDQYMKLWWQARKFLGLK